MRLQAQDRSLRNQNRYAIALPTYVLQSDLCIHRKIAAAKTEDRMSSIEHLVHYRNNGFNEVQGWCSEALFDTVALLDSVDINKHGGCLEIGVHHGRLYLLLNQVISASATSYAVDIFDSQHLNIDLSGAGSLKIFEDNLARFDVHKGANTQIVIGDSTDPALRLREIVGDNPLRFISVDGGHTVEHTISDLVLANDLISNEGVVILDDILNYHWLGVIEGVGRFLDRRPTLVPFAIGHNKLYMAKISFRSFYHDLFANSPMNTKIVNFYGHSVVAL